MEGSRAQSFDINNEKLRKLQAQGSFKSNGSVHVDYFGHSCFRITSPGGISVLIDPWRNDDAWGWWFPTTFPDVKVDIALSTHAHFDHDALHLPKALITIERLIGEYSLGDVKIIGLGDKHLSQSDGKTRWTDIQYDIGEDFSPPNNKLHMDNSIIVVECGGLRLVHWGDNRVQPDPFVHNYLQNHDIDVLFIPVDESEHIMKYADADRVMQDYSPALTIPMHYYVKGANTVLSTLQPADIWVQSHDDVLNISSHRLSISENQFTRDGTKIAFFGNNFTRE